MQNFAEWIGNKQISEDRCEERSIHMLQALFNKKDQPVNEMPHLFHWANFLPVVNQSEIAADGHPKKGDFLPPIPFPRRMWAGSRLEFIQPILVGQELRRVSEISDIQFKHGKNGELYFVTVNHFIYANDELVIKEQQDIVYKPETIITNNVSVTTTPVESPCRNYSFKQQHSVDTTALFRYSALTFNGHKIHYDRPYAMQVEGYPGLVVHGPLLATLLMQTLQDKYPDKIIKKFEFRAVKPVFDFNEFYICGDVQEQTAELWIEHSDGHIAMKAKLTFQE